MTDKSGQTLTKTLLNIISDLCSSGTLMKRWKLIAILKDLDYDILEVTEYNFDTYFECVAYKEYLTILYNEDPEVYDFKFTMVNL